MEFKEIVRNFIEENFMIKIDNKFSEEDSFLENGIIDSTGVLELISFLEKKFEIKISDDEIIPENLDSLMNIDNYIKGKITLKE